MTRNVALLLEQAAQEQPDQTFIITNEDRFAFMNVDAQARQIASALARIGVRPAQVVALLLPNTVSFVSCYFGALRLGAIVAPLNVTSPAFELAHFLQDSQAVVLRPTPISALYLGRNRPAVAAPEERFYAHFLRWAEPFAAEVRGQIGCASGLALHLWHGNPADRRYASRGDILRRANFDPATDLRLNDDAVWEWASAKPDLHRDVQAYFFARREDG